MILDRLWLALLRSGLGCQKVLDSKWQSSLAAWQGREGMWGQSVGVIHHDHETRMENTDDCCPG